MAQEKPTIDQGAHHRPTEVAGVRIEERRVVEDAPPSARLAGRFLS
jgi:hypothetical protein